MWTREFVRNLKYDAVPRTTVPIEQFNSAVAVTFDTTHATESLYLICTQCNRTVLGPRRLTTEHSCQIEAKD